MAINLENHPCFSDTARHRFGRIHLPVAPKCNIQCNFCNRKYDCVNESRPGVTSTILSPHQALAYLDTVTEQRADISVVGVAGPGDPFANPDKTLGTMELVRENYPDMILCLATNGLNLAPYVDDVARLDVSHVTVTVNAVDPVVGAKVYAWVRAGKKVTGPEKGAEILLEKQLEAIKALKERDVTVKVNTIIMPGVNDAHIEAVAKKMAELGVDVLNCMSYYPTAGSAFENLKPPSPALVTETRNKAGRYLSQMHHCTRCRADAVGLLGEAPNADLMAKLKAAKSLPRQKPAAAATTTTTAAPLTFDAGRPYIAAASLEGVLVNQHLGEADQLLIYGQKNGGVEFIETRQTPPAGGGGDRWRQLAELVSDCRALLVNGVGRSPQQIFAEANIPILEVEAVIEDAARAIFEGSSLNHMLKRDPTVCGLQCSGTGSGCG